MTTIRPALRLCWFSMATEVAEEASVLDASFDAGAAVSERAEPATKITKTAASVGSAPREEESTYTSRLLEAKRRALKGDDK